MPQFTDAMYAQCEQHLKDRMGAIERANNNLKEARAAAYVARGARLDKTGGHGSSSGSALENAALRVTQAEDELRRALKWDDIARRLRRAYPPESTRQGKLALLLYDRGMTQADAARIMGVERVTIRRWKDDYIMACIILAVEARLISSEV